MPRALAAIVILVLCLNATAVAGCGEDLRLADWAPGLHVLQDFDGAAGADSDCCAVCYCCARVFDNAHRAPERAFLLIFSRSDHSKVRLVDGYFTPPYHPPQIAG